MLTQLTPVLQELTASCGKEPSVTCSMLQGGNAVSSDFLPLLLSPALPDTPKTPCLLLSNSSRACPQGTSCQCILPTRQYFQGAHVFLILPHGFTLDKPLSNAPLTSMLLLSSPWSGPEVHKHSYGWPQLSITCLGLLENEQFLFHLWS